VSRSGERAGNTVRIDADVRFMGRTMSRSETHVLTPPERLEVRGGVPGMTNTTVWTFEPTPDGTTLTAVLDVQLAGLPNVLVAVSPPAGAVGAS
jgi:hypothetical protein